MSSRVKYKLIEDNRRLLERKLSQLLALNKISKNSVKVGVPANSPDHEQKHDESGTKEKPVSMVLIAAANEFGTEDGRIPERSFLRSTIKKNNEKYKRLFKSISKKLIDNPQDYIKLMSKIGTIAQGDVQNTIRDLKEPPNAPATIARKKSDNPLVDTGQLGSSIVYQITKEK